MLPALLLGLAVFFSYFRNPNTPIFLSCKAPRLSSY